MAEAFQARLTSKRLLAIRVACWWICLSAMGAFSVRLLVWLVQKVGGHAKPADDRSALLCLGGYFTAAAAWIAVTGLKRKVDG